LNQIHKENTHISAQMYTQMQFPFQFSKLRDELLTDYCICKHYLEEFNYNHSIFQPKKAV